MRKPIVLAAVLAFVAVSVILGRWLSAEGAERAAVEELLAAQAHGNPTAMLDLLGGCGERPRCRTTVERAARGLRSPGRPQIVFYESTTTHALGAATGPTRVVWRARGRLPTVQCITVRRKRTFITGPVVTLTSVSLPIRRDGSCPRR